MNERGCDLHEQEHNHPREEYEERKKLDENEQIGEERYAMICEQKDDNSSADTSVRKQAAGAFPPRQPEISSHNMKKAEISSGSKDFFFFFLNQSVCINS